jgi:hypothetical protein
MILDPLLDFFRGKTITIPPMDGAFRPNRHLDEAAELARLAEPDNLICVNGTLAASSGNALFSLQVGREPALLQSFGAPIASLAVSPSGEIAAGLESGVLTVGGRNVGLPPAVNCITALAFAPDGRLWLANGSAEHGPGQWAADLMKKGASGSLWTLEPEASDFRQVAGGLAFPNGLLVQRDGIVVSESWRHRLIRVDGGTGAQASVVDHLPGYPARLSPAADGAWLCLFAPRNRLVEFVLQEEHYRHDMLSQVPPAYWIAPALSSGRSFLEPLQCGGIKTMGVHKPWSPSRSYGLVVKLGPDLRPLSSLHSRADGIRHGICSVIEHDGRLVVASKGGDCLIAVETTVRVQ